MPGMADTGPPSQGTMLMSALLVLALLFAGAWIYEAAEPGEDATWLLPWFGLAAAVILVVSFLNLLRGNWRGGGR